MAGATERGIVYPTSGDTITPLETAFATLAQTADDAITDLEPQTVQVFENTADRDAASVPEGSFCFVKNIDEPFYYDGTNWIQFTPSSLDAAVITSGVFDTARIPTDISVDYATSAGSTSSASYATSAGSASSVPWSGITSRPSTFPPSAHNHAAGDINSGTLATARIPAITNSMISDQTIQGSRGAGTSKISPNTIGQADIDVDSIGPSELIETGDYTMGGLSVDGVLIGDSVTARSGNLYINNVTTGSSTTANTRLVAVATGVHQVALTGSARKYKIDEMPLDTGMKILNLQPKWWFDKLEYEINNESIEGLQRIPGFVAEDLIAADMYEFVTFNDDTGEIQGIAYDRLMAAAIPVMKNQQERIANLEARLLALEGKVE